jgi:fatty acid desaturase
MLDNSVEANAMAIEGIKLTLTRWITGAGNLLKGIKQETKRIKPLIFETGVMQMLKKLFVAVEAAIRAAIYLLVLLMGLAIAALGAYTIIFLTIRVGQFLWVLIFKDKWI